MSRARDKSWIAIIGEFKSDRGRFLSRPPIKLLNFATFRERRPEMKFDIYENVYPPSLSLSLYGDKRVTDRSNRNPKCSVFRVGVSNDHITSFAEQIMRGSPPPLFTELSCTVYRDPSNNRSPPRNFLISPFIGRRSANCR